MPRLQNIPSKTAGTISQPYISITRLGINILGDTYTGYPIRKYYWKIPRIISEYYISLPYRVRIPGITFLGIRIFRYENRVGNVTIIFSYRGFTVPQNLLELRTMHQSLERLFQLPQLPFSLGWFQAQWKSHNNFGQALRRLPVALYLNSFGYEDWFFSAFRGIVYSFGLITALEAITNLD